MSKIKSKRKGKWQIVPCKWYEAKAQVVRLLCLHIAIYKQLERSHYAKCMMVFALRTLCQDAPEIFFKWSDERTTKRNVHNRFRSSNRQKKRWRHRNWNENCYLCRSSNRAAKNVIAGSREAFISLYNIRTTMAYIRAMPSEMEWRIRTNTNTAFKQTRRKPKSTDKQQQQNSSNSSHRMSNNNVTNEQHPLKTSTDRHTNK